MVIRDKIALGTVAGLIGSIPQLIFQFTMLMLGISNYSSFQISGGIFLLEKYTKTIGGLIYGFIIWEIAAIFLGVVTVYVIESTGHAHAWFKGIVVSTAIMFIGVYGFVFEMGGSNIVPQDIPTNFVILIGNLIFGATTGYMILRLGRVERKDYK